MSQKIKTSVEIDGSLKASQIANATTDTDKFLVSDDGTIKYRTGSQMLSDLGVAPGVASKIEHQVKASVDVNKGQAVYAIPTQDGTNILVGLASNSSEPTSSKTMGLLDNTVPANGFANVVTEGLLAGLNTIGATVGDPVWLGTSGNLIYGLANKPYAPNHLVFIGIVTRVNANNGEIFVKVQNGFELDELHNVDLKTTIPINGHVLGYDGTLWVNKTIAGWLGFTPANDNNVVHKTGTETIDGVKTFSSAMILNSSLNIVGGGYSILYNPGTTGYWQNYVDSSNVYNFGYNGINVKAKIDTSGNFTANSFIKSGGTASQILAADGSVITAGTGITISGGTISSSASGGVTSFNTRTGAVTLSSGDVTTALGYTPISSLTDTLATVTARGALTTSDIFTPNNGGIFFNGNAVYGSGVFGKNAGQDLAFNAGGVVRGRFLSTGFFGIGTETPVVKFNIKGDASTGYPTLGTSKGAVLIAGDTNLYGLYIGNDGSSGNAWVQSMRNDTATAYNIIMQPSGGNVAIGNTTATYKLSVTGNGNTLSINPHSAGVDIHSTGNFAPHYQTNFTWYYGNIGSGAQRASLDSSGNFSATGTISASGTGGFASSTYVSGARNPIWRFGNADAYGLSYFQSTAGIGGLDTIGFHFGTATASGSQFQFRSDGYAYASGYLEGGASLRAPIFYDSQNTGYYVDPSSTSNLNGLTVGNTITGSVSGSSGSVGGVSASQIVYGSGSSKVSSHSNANEWRNSGFYENDGGGSNWPSATWYNSINVRHSNQGNYHGFQVAMSYYDNNLWFRSYQGSGTFQGWQRAAVARGEGTNYIDYSRYVYNNGAYSGSGWVEPSDLGVRYAASSNYANSSGSSGNAGHLSTAYIGGQRLNPQDYFNNGVGLKAAMTAKVGVWSDTLWINGYSGGDVLWMCALHTQRNSSPRMYISAQQSTSTSYGTAYEFLTDYNVGEYAVTKNTDQDITGIKYFLTNNNAYSGSTSSAKLQAYSTGNNSAFFSFHKAGYYAVNMGLDADNVIRIGGWSASANRWQLDMSGNMTAAGDVTAYSDIRIKENIKTIDSALDKVLSLRGVTYNRTDSEDKAEKIGVIAQEIQEVLPQVVHEQADGMLGVSYGNITAVLIEAIKEQQTQIEELKELVKHLTKQ